MRFKDVTNKEKQKQVLRQTLDQLKQAETLVLEGVEILENSDSVISTSFTASKKREAYLKTILKHFDSAGDSIKSWIGCEYHLQDTQGGHENSPSPASSKT